MVEDGTFQPAEVVDLAVGRERARAVRDAVQLAVPVGEEAADRQGGGGLAGVVANLVAPGVELHGRARVVQDKFVEAVAGQIALVPFAAFVVSALLVVEHVLGADDAADAG